MLCRGHLRKETWMKNNANVGAWTSGISHRVRWWPPNRSLSRYSTKKYVWVLCGPVDIQITGDKHSTEKGAMVMKEADNHILKGRLWGSGGNAKAVDWGAQQRKDIQFGQNIVFIEETDFSLHIRMIEETEHLPKLLLPPRKSLCWVGICDLKN